MLRFTKMFDSEILRSLPQVAVTVMVVCRSVCRYLARNQMRFGVNSVSQLASWKLKKEDEEEEKEGEKEEEKRKEKEKEG
jgi:hypothetical protein